MSAPLGYRLAEVRECDGYSRCPDAEDLYYMDREFCHGCLGDRTQAVVTEVELERGHWETEYDQYGYSENKFYFEPDPTGPHFRIKEDR